MHRQGVTNPEPAQGSQRPGLRGPGAEVLRLMGYPVVRQVLADLGRRSCRPSEIDLGWRVDVSTFHRHAPELLAVKAITRQTVPGPPRQVFYSLGPTGAELCALIDGWLALLPSAHRTDWRGPIATGVGQASRRNGVALVWAEVGHGRVVASGSGRQPQPADTWVRGTIGQWMATVIDHRRDGIRAAGEGRLGRAVVDALHTRLYRRYGPWR